MAQSWYHDWHQRQFFWRSHVSLLICKPHAKMKLIQICVPFALFTLIFFFSSLNLFLFTLPCFPCFLSSFLVCYHPLSLVRLWLGLSYFTFSSYTWLLITLFFLTVLLCVKLSSYSFIPPLVFSFFFLDVVLVSYYFIVSVGVQVTHTPPSFFSFLFVKLVHTFTLHCEYLKKKCV